MSHSIVAFAILALLQTAIAVDLSQTKDIQVDLTEKDIVPKTALKSLVPETYANGFIGNLEIGRRYPDELIFRRVIEINNPTNAVQSAALTITLNGKTLHYLNAMNENGSYAVVCDDSTTLGTSRGTIHIRTGSNTKSYLTLIVAAH